MAPRSPRVSRDGGKQKLPVKVVSRAKVLVAPVKPRTPPNERKAKVVAALKRLHPMD